MDDKQILELARAHVASHLHASGRIVRHKAHPVAAGSKALAPPSLDEQMAKELGVTAPPPPADSADVEFSEHTDLGPRGTVVQIRNGKVARVLMRG
jgi:hypothetical protein